MGIIDRHLRQTLKEAPKLFILEWVCSNLKDAGIEAMQAEDLARQFVASGMTEFKFEDGTDRKIDLVFTDEDAAKLDRAVDNFTAEVPNLIQTVAFEAIAELHKATKSGLPLITTPASKLEPGRGRPALGLTEAERRADQALAARSLLEPAGGNRVMSAV